MAFTVVILWMAETHRQASNQSVDILSFIMQENNLTQNNAD